MLPSGSLNQAAQAIKRTDSNVCPIEAKKSLTNLGRDSRLISMTRRDRLEWLSGVPLLVFLWAAGGFFIGLSAVRIVVQGRVETRANRGGVHGAVEKQIL